MPCGMPMSSGMFRKPSDLGYIRSFCAGYATDEPLAPSRPYKRAGRASRQTVVSNRSCQDLLDARSGWRGCLANSKACRAASVKIGLPPGNIGLAAGQHRACRRHSGSVAGLSRPVADVPGWSLGERCRRAPGNVGLSSSNTARRICAESAPGNIGLPAGCRRAEGTYAAGQTSGF